MLSGERRAEQASSTVCSVDGSVREGSSVCQLQLHMTHDESVQERHDSECLLQQRRTGLASFAHQNENVDVTRETRGHHRSQVARAADHKAPGSTPATSVRTASQLRHEGMAEYSCWKVRKLKIELRVRPSAVTFAAPALLFISFGSAAATILALALCVLIPLRFVMVGWIRRT
jgi:hypothetical protein